LGHLGGDRFAVLLPEKSSDGAMKMAERLREAVAVTALRMGKSSTADNAQATLAGHVTVSLGVAAVRPGDTLDSVLAAADGALHQAKTDGRNRVKMATAHR